MVAAILARGSGLLRGFFPFFLSHNILFKSRAKYTDGYGEYWNGKTTNDSRDELAHWRKVGHWKLSYDRSNHILPHEQILILRGNSSYSM
jgi:hypothetical protein